MVQPSPSGAGQGSAAVPDADEAEALDETEAPEKSDVRAQHVPEKQIYRWKDDGGAVMPDA